MHFEACSNGEEKGSAGSQAPTGAKERSLNGLGLLALVQLTKANRPKRPQPVVYIYIYCSASIQVNS